MIDRIAGAYRGAFSGFTREVWLLALVGFINRSGTMVLPFLALYLTQKQGFAPADAGMVLALYGVGAAAGTLGGGWLSDRWDPHTVQIVSLLASTAAFVTLGRLEAPWAIAAGIGGLALVAEAFRPANSTALARAATPGTRARVFALRRLAINLGMTFGPAVGGFLAVRDYAWLFLVDGATCALATLPLVALLRRRHAEAAGAGEAPRAPAGGGRSPWRDGPYLAFLALVTLFGILLFQLWGAFPLTLRAHYGLDESEIGLVFAINTLIIVAFEMVLIQAVRRRSPFPLMAAGALLLGGGLALVPGGTTFAWAALGAVVWTAGEMLTAPLAEAAGAERATASGGQSGRYMGLFATTFSLAFIVAPALGTAVYGRYGPTPLWLGCGVVGALLAVGFLALERHWAPAGRQGVESPPCQETKASSGS